MKNRSTCPKGKGKRTESNQEKVTVAIVNNANNFASDISEQFLQFGPSMNSYLKAEGNLEQIRRTRTSMKGIIGLTRKLPSERVCITPHVRVWMEQDLGTHFHL